MDRDVYERRREAACEIWRNVPDAQWDMEVWVQRTACGTVGCALGWLGELRHDGWRLGQENVPRTHTMGENQVLMAAQDYFGFPAGLSTEIFYHRIHGSTQRSVCEAVMNAPYVIYDDE